MCKTCDKCRYSNLLSQALFRHLHVDQPFGSLYINIICSNVWLSIGASLKSILKSIDELTEFAIAVLILNKSTGKFSRVVYSE